MVKETKISMYRGLYVLPKLRSWTRKQSLLLKAIGQHAKSLRKLDTDVQLRVANK